MAEPGRLRDLLRAPVDGLRLADIDTRGTPGVKSRKAAEAQLSGIGDRLGSLQERLFVEGTRSVLIVLQAMDTGGKDGTIEHVVRWMNPAGLEVVSFKQPTEEELAHDFLWRIRKRLPVQGEIVIFNRSQYEDVLVVRVHDLVPENVWAGRFERINVFERELARAGTTIVKLFLHISYDEQRDRLLARLDDPQKHWKFNEGDIDERARWGDYQAAYEDAIARCSTDLAPWYVIPADRKWYRNWAVGTILAETLMEMDPRFPQPDLDVARLKALLEPPH